MKKTIKLLGITALVAVIGLMMAGCPADADEKGPVIRTVRYDTVPFGSNNFGRSADDDDPYVLVNSLVEHDGSAYYYLFYMGYIKNVPIAHKDPYRYDGITPMTLTWEQTWSEEDTVTYSMAKAKEETWKVSAGVTAGLEVGVKGGVAPVAETEVKKSISITVGAEYGRQISTTETLETSKMRMRGETQTLSATIGDHGEKPGRYRFALFSTTDVFCLFKVHPVTREVISADVVNCAREDSYAWGIDFSPDDRYSKTGTGELFDISLIDLTSLPVPTEVTDGPPEVCDGKCECDGHGSCGHVPCNCPDTKRIVFETWTGDMKTRASRVSGGDSDVNTQAGRFTDWSLEVKNIRLINARGDGTFADITMDFIYTVTEVASNYTKLQMEMSKTFPLSGRKVIEIPIESPTENMRYDRFAGKNNSKVPLGGWYNDSIIRYVYGQLDGPGGDENNLLFEAYIRIELIERR